MILELTYLADEHERFARRAFDNQVGKEIPVNLLDDRRTGIIRAAKVADDGKSAVVTVEVPD